MLWSSILLRRSAPVVANASSLPSLCTSDIPFQSWRRRSDFQPRRPQTITIPLSAILTNQGFHSFSTPISDVYSSIIHPTTASPGAPSLSNSSPVIIVILATFIFIRVITSINPTRSERRGIFGTATRSPAVPPSYPRSSHSHSRIQSCPESCRPRNYSHGTAQVAEQTPLIYSLLCPY